MNNFNNYAEIDRISSQLDRAELKKIRLIHIIHREYEFYLNLLRDLLFISVEKGLNELYSCLSIRNDFLNTSEFFEKKISKLIYNNLPLLTIEQLKINQFEKNIKKEVKFNSIESFLKTKDDQKENSQYEDRFQLEEPLQFEISNDNSNASEYYQADNYEKLTSLDLDNKDHIKNLSVSNFIENIGLEKQFISSLIELIEEVSVEIPRYSEEENINEIDSSSEYKSLRMFDLIERSLENSLLNLSYKINQELFKANLIKKIISKDSFKYLLGNKFMIKHPHPFVINFVFNLNHSFLKEGSHPSIIFFNISTVELEYKNLNLSIQRNKINELKIQFQRLIKKEAYWRQKEITLNKIR